MIWNYTLIDPNLSRNRYCAFEGKTPCSLAVQLSLSTTINCSAILTSPSVPGTVKYCFCGDKFIRIFMNSFVLNLKLLICFKHKRETKICSKNLTDDWFKRTERAIENQHNYQKVQNKILDMFLFVCKIFIELLQRRVGPWYYLWVRTFRRWSRSLQISSSWDFHQISWHFNQRLFFFDPLQLWHFLLHFWFCAFFILKTHYI